MNDRDLIRALGDLPAPRPDAALMRRIADDAALEHAFARARRDPPQPSELLMARITQDARRARPWVDATAWGGMVAAGLVGLAIGSTTFDATGAASYDLAPSYDFQLLDGD